MELTAAIVVGGPLGYHLGTRRRLGLVLCLLVWAAIFPIQTAVVHAADPSDIEPPYFVFNALILALGITLNQLGPRYRVKRGTGEAPA